MKKVSLSLLLVIGIVFSLSTTEAKKAEKFIDIDGHPKKEAIEYLRESEIAHGYEDGTFQPNDKIIRAGFLAIIIEANADLKEKLENLKNGNSDEIECKSFPDVKKKDWFYNQVCVATHSKIASGHPDGSFKPGDPITFGEAATIIANVEKLDITEDEAWPKGEMQALEKERITPADITDARDEITRGQMAEIIWAFATGNEPVNDGTTIKKISSCEEIALQAKKFQKRNSPRGMAKSRSFKTMELDMDMAEPMVDEAMPESVAAENKTEGVGSDDGAGAAEYSQTNVQEFGVDEADIVKNDGSHIFLIKGKTIRIIKAYPASSLSQEATITVDNNQFSPQEMYLDEDILTVIGSSWEEFPLPDSSAESNTSGLEPEGLTASQIAPYPGRSSGSVVKVVIFDVKDRTKPEQKRSISFEGNYLTSRKIADIVYVVANKYENFYSLLRMEEDNLPKFRDSAHADERLACDCVGVGYFPNFKESNYLVLAGIDTKNKDSKVTRKVLLGAGNNVYASTKNMYVTKSKFGEVFVDEDGNSSWKREEFTDIYKFALDELSIEFKHKGKAQGRPLNQFSMSEYKDNFRIATQVGRAWGSGLSSSGVTIFDKEIKELSKVDGIAPGENMKSARFMGNKAYLVTFKTVDPLFVIDLNPEDPKVLGKLKIPGWSDYLHPFGENHLIGFGKEVDESIDADKVHSDNAVYYTAVLGMKLAIFDVTDLENPKETHKEVIGFRGTESEVLTNHKALLFDKAKGILAFPVTVTENKNDKKGRDADVHTVFSGAYFYDIDLEKGFSLKGKVSHYPNDSWYNKSGEYFYGDQDYNISRAIYIGENFYTISQNVIKALEWDDISEKKSLILDEKKCSEIHNEEECKNNSSCKATYRKVQECNSVNGVEVCEDNGNEFVRCEDK